MEILAATSFQEQTSAYDQLVWQMSGIDCFCSSSAWGLSVQEAFNPEAVPYFLKGSAGYVALFPQIMPQWGRMLLPLDASWFLACPLVSIEPKRLLSELHTALSDGTLAWDSCLLSGLTQGSPLFMDVVRQFTTGNFKLFQGPSVTRRIGDLRGGLDAYFKRRSARFCKNLRRTHRQVTSADIRFQWWHDPLTNDQQEAIFERIMRVESNSWKGQTGVGVDAGGMRSFYKRLMARQAQPGILRIGFALQNGEDIGYILGGVMGRLYRGYQFSFKQEFSTLSLGNWMQQQAIEALCREGVLFYDLGTDMAYKEKWADIAYETISLIIAR